MSKTELRFHYQFQAVGQGLFAWGELWDEANQKHFDWVFDCGTASGINLLRREVPKYKQRLGSRPIGLFCISHFDEDHINGARELLQQQRVDVLVLPYFPLVERMQIAIETPGISPDHLRFLVDPGDYILTVLQANVGQIIYVAGDAGFDDNDGGLVPIVNPENSGDGWNLEPTNPRSPSGRVFADLGGVSLTVDRRVQVLSHRQSFVLGNDWEFVFYNLNIPDSKAVLLRSEVAAIVTEYRNDDGSYQGVELLAQLKSFYDDEFGSSGTQRNKISLVVYSGPISTTQPTGFWLRGVSTPVSFGVPYPYYAEEFFNWCHPYYGASSNGTSYVSILYFGDFPLTSIRRLNALRKHLTTQRWASLQIVQVPHHGSAHSWFTGAAAEFAHGASVFSSRRQSADHPSEEVLQDLDSHGVILVNERQGALFYGGVARAKP